MSPTERSLEHMRRLGFTAQVVERWIPQARRRIDLFGVIDLVCLKPGQIIGVQTTSGGNLAARRTKSMAEPRLREWLSAGARYELHGWRKAGPRKTWGVVREELALDESGQVVVMMSKPARAA